MEYTMDIVSIRHGGLREYYLTNSARGLKQDLVPRIRTVLFALAAAPDIEAPDIEALEGPRAGASIGFAGTAPGSGRYPYRVTGG